MLCLQFIDTENLDDDDPNLIPVMLPLSAAGAMVAKKEAKEEEKKEVKDTVDGIKGRCETVFFSSLYYPQGPRQK